MIGLILCSFAEMGQAGLWPSTAKAPERIALLLPLRGAYAESGQAIRDGFLAAYYQSLPQDTLAPTIRIIDTSSGDIVALYRRAVEQGAHIIVGPLRKEEGAQLVQANALTVPTLFLNTLPSMQTVPANLYQFSLSPEDEARQAAAKAWRDGKKSAVVMMPANAWGRRVAQVFLNEWQALGGIVAGEMYYDQPQQLSTQISQMLHVDQSEQRAKELRRLLQTKMRAIPYRRQDIDMVFLVAKPEFARQIRPLLGFYYAGKIPVYATSHLYSGAPNPQYDHDLNGVLFCAIPWEIAPQTLAPDLQAILASVQKTWPQALQKQSQFFALGADSYRLARQLSAGALPSTIDGATGKLILQSNKVWYRQLPWAQMRQGQPQPLMMTERPTR